jgi:hypothetical protein
MQTNCKDHKSFKVGQKVETTSNIQTILQINRYTKKITNTMTVLLQDINSPKT